MGINYFNVRMLFAEYPLQDVESFSVVLQRLGIITLRIIYKSDVVVACSYIRMLFAEYFLPDVESFPVVLQRLGIITLRLIY